MRDHAPSVANAFALSRTFHADNRFTNPQPFPLPMGWVGEESRRLVTVVAVVFLMAMTPVPVFLLFAAL
jgi:hypothetical protein